MGYAWSSQNIVLFIFMITFLNVLVDDPLTHTPHITAVEAGRSTRRDVGIVIPREGYKIVKKWTPPFLGGIFTPKRGVE